jgi:HSP20 family protein
MAEKSGNVTVKKNGGEGKQGRAPLPAPYGPMSGMRGELDRMFNRFFPEGWPHMSIGNLMDFDPFRGVSGFETGTALQSAKADISETDSEYEISVELPGIEEKDIELDVSEGMLTLLAEKREEREEKKKNYHLTERSYGRVRRSFRVPEGVEVGKIKAEFSKGVLQVTLPKTKEAKAKQRKIPVKTS